MAFERPKRSTWERLFLLGVGWMFLVVGLIGGVIPIFQGWPFGIAGLLILSREYEWAHNLVERLRRRFPRFGRIMDRTGESAHRIMERFLGRKAA